MRDFFVTAVLVVLCVAPPTTTHAQGSTETLPARSARYVFSAGYANDNVILEEVVGAVFATGLDDLVTTSFWLRLDRRRLAKSTSVGARLDVLTHRDGNYRADLLTLRATHEPVNLPGRLRIGFGIVGRGNFGGSAVQNKYHALFDYGIVDLPYSSGTKLAPLVNVEYTTDGLGFGLINAAAFVSAENTFSVGPSYAKTGVRTKCCGRWARGDQFAVQLEGEIAYTRYYHLHPTIAPMFGRGFATGLAISVHGTDALGASLWLTRNQYGVSNLPQFGLSISYGWGVNAPRARME